MVLTKKRTPLSIKLKTKNKFLIYCKYNFLNNSAKLLLINMFIPLLISIFIVFIFDADSLKSITTEILIMSMLATLFTSSIGNTPITLNKNIDTKVNRIFMLGGMKRNQILKYALVYNAIITLIQALLAILLFIIMFGIASIVTKLNFIVVFNLYFIAMLILIILSSYMFSLMCVVVTAPLPKNAIRFIIVFIFWVIQYLMIGISFGLVDLLISENKVVIAWLLMLIPSLTSASNVWWTQNHWLIFAGYAYNIILIFLFIWIWSKVNKRKIY